jgi:hypothetical protein
MCMMLKKLGKRGRFTEPCTNIAYLPMSMIQVHVFTFLVRVVISIRLYCHCRRFMFYLCYLYLYWYPTRFPYRKLFVLINSNITGATSGAGTAYPSVSPACTPVCVGFVWQYKIEEWQTIQWPKDTRGVIKSRKSRKDRQYNGHKIRKG